MHTLHLPRSLEHVSTSIKNSDPVAWIVLVLAIGSLAVLLAATYFR